jgi:hypothetical protein
MVLLLAAALVSSAPAHPVAASAQATATIRVLSAVQIKFGSSGNDGVPPARDTVLKTADGNSQPAKLIEFQ